MEAPEGSICKNHWILAWDMLNAFWATILTTCKMNIISSNEPITRMDEGFSMPRGGNKTIYSISWTSFFSFFPNITQSTQTSGIPTASSQPHYKSCQAPGTKTPNWRKIRRWTQKLYIKEKNTITIILNLWRTSLILINLATLEEVHVGCGTRLV